MNTLTGTPAELTDADVYIKNGRLELCSLEMENQILGEELLKARDKYWNVRTLAIVLGLAVVFLGATHTKPWVQWVVAGFFFLTGAVMLIGGLCYAAKRGDEAMGIGNTQGR